MRRLIMLLSGVAVAACGTGEIEVATITCADITADLTSRRADMITTPSGLMYEELAEGRGKAAEAGDQVYTHYTLCSTDGQELDSSLAPGRGETLNFNLGEMIAGFNEGVEGMKAGGRRILVLPPELAYGEAGRPGIPPNATLVFYVQLMSIATD